MVLVYNISYPLAFLLASVGFLTSGKLSFHAYHGPPRRCSRQDNQVATSWVKNILARITDRATSLAAWICPSWTLDLHSLSQRGSLNIAHDGSFVHPDGGPSTSPDPARLESLLQRALKARDSKGHLKGGLDLDDLVRIRTENALSLDPKLSGYHDQIAVGECSLLWELLGDRPDVDGVIPTNSLRQWLGEEQLPDGWWDSRPKDAVGLLRTRKVADEVARMSKQIAEEAEPTLHDATSTD